MFVDVELICLLRKHPEYRFQSCSQPVQVRFGSMIMPLPISQLLYLTTCKIGQGVLLSCHLPCHSAGTPSACVSVSAFTQLCLVFHNQALVFLRFQSVVCSSLSRVVVCKLQTRFLMLQTSLKFYLRMQAYHIIMPYVLHTIKAVIEQLLQSCSIYGIASCLFSCCVQQVLLDHILHAATGW